MTTFETVPVGTLHNYPTPQPRGGDVLSEGTKTILIVDDNAMSRELIREALGRDGYSILEADDGRAALDLMAEVRPDLVVMDIHMPVLDGYETVKEMRGTANLETIPTIAVTAYAMLGDRERALSAGFDSYVVKPVNVTALRLQIAQLLH